MVYTTQSHFTISKNYDFTNFYPYISSSCDYFSFPEFFLPIPTTTNRNTPHGDRGPFTPLLFAKIMPPLPLPMLRDYNP